MRTLEEKKEAQRQSNHAYYERRKRTRELSSTLDDLISEAEELPKDSSVREALLQQAEKVRIELRAVDH